MSKLEAEELTEANYMSSLMLDIVSFMKAKELLQEEHGSLQQRWEHCTELFVNDIKRFQKSMAASDICFWQPTDRRGLRLNAKWLFDAVSAANANRTRVKGLLGIKDEDILQVNVLCLHQLGTVKRQVLKNCAAALPGLSGIT